MDKRSEHYEPYLRWIEQINELNRQVARGGPYLYINPYNTVSHPETVIGLKPGHSLSYDHLGVRHMFFAGLDGLVEHDERPIVMPVDRRPSKSGPGRAQSFVAPPTGPQAAPSQPGRPQLFQRIRAAFDAKR